VVDVGTPRPHPLGEVSSSWPTWVRWMLHGIVIGKPLQPQEIVRHVVDDDAPPPLPQVAEPAVAEPVRLIDVRFGRGCYGLAEGARLEFGPRLTLVYGENGCGKSSIARVLRAAVGRPSSQRPPHHSFTGAAAEAAVRYERDAGPVEAVWSAGGRLDGLHVEVFDSADTRVDGTEFQVRPRSVLALEELRLALDGLRFEIEPLVVPDAIREMLSVEDLLALEGSATALGAVETWRAYEAGQAVTEIEAALAALGDQRLAERRSAVEDEGRRAARDVAFLECLEGIGLRELSARMVRSAAAAPDLDGVEPPEGVDRDMWIAFVRRALPLFASQSKECVLCGSDIEDAHSDRVSMLHALLDDQRAALGLDADTAAQRVRDAALTYEGASGSSELRAHAADIVGALAARDGPRLVTAAERVDPALWQARGEHRSARLTWQECQRVLREAEGERANGRARLVAARRAEALAQHAGATDELVGLLIRRQRMSAAARSAGLKQRVNSALKAMTTAVLETAYGAALSARLDTFRVPHVDLLTARHAAKGGRTRRRHVVAGTSTDVLFSEGEQRALALADFAAELDTRPATRHPAVLDDPVSSLDYRRLDHVVRYVRSLVDQGRQVVVLTHSLWLAAALLKMVKDPKNGSGPDRAWMLVTSPDMLGTTARLTTSVLGGVDDLAEKIDATIAKATAETDLGVRCELTGHGLSLLRAWCESFVEQKVLCNVVARLDVQVRPTKLVDIDQVKLARGQAVAQVYDRLHQRIDAHAQPGELLHRSDDLGDLVELWADARRTAGLRP
jgi:energy-coupling factor transporter ATP-binding protein EcfA2